MTFNQTQETILDAFADEQRTIELGSHICQELINQNYDISSFVESLGFALTSQDVDMRVKGTMLLSLVLSKLPVHMLTSAQLDYIAMFYCDRLKDHHNVIPAIIKGLTSLVQMQHLDEGTIIKIVTQFFLNVSCQSQNREDRADIYNWIKLISDFHPKEVAVMGANYVFNVMNAMDGERDPRNLVFIFEYMPRFLEEFPLYHLAEDMFESFACYFPVDFHPVKDDPQSITRDCLAERLSFCLVANPDFAKFAILLATEKLRSDLIIAKLDSLALLKMCSGKFKSCILDEHFDDIWTSLKSELFSGSGNNKLLSQAYDTLLSILKAVSVDVEANKNVQTKVLSNVIPYVTNINHHLFAPAIRVAELCIQSSNDFASAKILGALALHLQQEELITETKVQLLDQASRILDVCSKAEGFEELDTSIREPIQKTILDGIHAKDSEIATQAWRITERALGLLSYSQRKEMFDRLLHVLTDDIGANDVALVIQKYAEKYPEEITENLIHPIHHNFHKLSINAKRKVYMNVIQLSKMSRFENQLLSLLTKQIFSNDNEEEVNTALLAMQTLLKNNAESLFVRMVWLNYNFMDNFQRLITRGNYKMETLTQMSLVISLCLPHLSIAEQQKIVNDYMEKFHSDYPANVFLMQGIFSQIDESVVISPYFQTILSSLVNQSLNMEHKILRTVCHTLLSSLVNRIDATEANHKEIMATVSFLQNEIKKGRKAAIEVLAWIIKGLLVKGYPGVDEMVVDISELLNHPDLSTTAVEAFDILTKEDCGLRLPVVKFLYKQKFFHIVLGQLWDKLIQFEEKHAIAFALALGMAPHPILKLYFEKVAPIIFKCIDAKNERTAEIALTVVKNFLIERNEYLRSHFSHLIPQLIALTTRSNSMATRIGSLACLEEICKYPVYVVQPYKIDVILGLAGSLDDKKRLVRQSATRARNAWFLLGTESLKT